MNIINSKNKFTDLLSCDYRFHNYLISLNKHCSLADDVNKEFFYRFYQLIIFLFIFISIIYFFIFVSKTHAFVLLDVQSKIFFSTFGIIYIFILYLFHKKMFRINNVYESFSNLLNKIKFDINLSKNEFLDILYLLSYENNIEYTISLVSKNEIKNKFMNENIDKLDEKVILIKFKNELYWQFINYKEGMLDGISYYENNVFINNEDKFKSNIKNLIYPKYELGYSLSFNIINIIFILFIISFYFINKNMVIEDENKYNTFVSNLEKDLDNNLILIKNDKNEYIRHDNVDLNNNIISMNNIYKNDIIKRINENFTFDFYDLKDKYNQENNIISKENFYIIKEEIHLNYTQQKYYLKNKFSNHRIDIENTLYKNQSDTNINIFKYMHL